jgi:hypothetical protein
MDSLVASFGRRRWDSNGEVANDNRCGRAGVPIVGLTARVSCRVVAPGTFMRQRMGRSTTARARGDRPVLIQESVPDADVAVGEDRRPGPPR